MATAKSFVNDKGVRVVEECLDGMTLVHHSQLRKLSGQNVLVRSDFEEIKDKEVVLLSGGGSGHEPDSGGLVGAGMLTAAVCGNIFSSPSMDAVLATLRTITGKKGCLMILKNYTGDRLNFGLAAEQAKHEGLDVEMVVVGDDAALEGKGVTGRRGVAGVSLVYKIAGAAAARGGNLANVTKAAAAAALSVRTVGVALSPCDIPGKPINTRLSANDGQMELGLGIHGEAGRETLPVMETDALLARQTDILLKDFVKVDDGHVCKRVVALLNNLGGTTALEMYAMCDSMARQYAERGITIERLYVGPLVTSLQMHGVSVSLLDADLAEARGAEGLLDLCDAGTTAVGWIGAVSTFRGGATKPDTVDVKQEVQDAAENSDIDDKSPKLTPEEGGILERKVRAAAKALQAAEPELTKWDTICGDGDAGFTMEKGALIALENFGDVDFTRPLSLLLTLSESAKKMGGSSGAVLAILFTAAASKLRSGSSYADALLAGVQAVSKYGGAKPGYRTMLDPLHEMSLAACKDPGVMDAKILAEAAEKGAEATKQMEASAGRSNYIPDSVLNGTPDPGAKAVEIVMKAFANIL